MSSSHRGLAILAAASIALGFFGLAPLGAGPGGNGNVVANPTVGPSTGNGPITGPNVSGSGGNQPGQIGSNGSAKIPPARAFKCAPGLNGGSTDKGVSASRIKLASTAVLDGAAASLLRHSVTAMRAVVNKVNRAGGICGRILDLTIRNDGFQSQLGLQFIKNFIQDDYFALAVVPSAEGLGSAILNGEIDKAGIPVVGTDGMRKEQYRSPWVWPVATATVSTMRTLAQYGYKEKKAKSFAIVYDDQYKFGEEGRDAFKQQVKAMGGTIKVEQPLQPNEPSYASQAAEFNRRCKDNRGEPTCDMVAMLLLPDTGAKWMATKPAIGRLYTAGAQTMFTEDYAQKCVRNAGSDCHEFTAWTGYNPALGRFAGLKDVNTYVNDVRSVDPRAPLDNQFMEGAYLGMSVLVKALEKVGPDLTRARLRSVLDSMAYKTDLSSTLTWRPGKHAANIRARAFSIVYGGGRFQGWRDQNTGFKPDPAGGP